MLWSDDNEGIAWINQDCEQCHGWGLHMTGDKIQQYWEIWADSLDDNYITCIYCSFCYKNTIS